MNFHLSFNSLIILIVEMMCNNTLSKCRNGKCLGTYNSAQCVCKPGWQGSTCDKTTKAKMFKEHNFIRYGLNFDLNPYSTDIQLLFRTRELFGDLIRLSTKDKREYCILEIRDARIQFRFNLNHMRSSTEQILNLNNVFVNDGEWHLVRVKRFGSSASIKLDAGGADKVAAINEYKELHQLIKIERRNVFIGDDVGYDSGSHRSIRMSYSFLLSVNCKRLSS